MNILLHISCWFLFLFTRIDIFGMNIINGSYNTRIKKQNNQNETQDPTGLNNSATESDNSTDVKRKISKILLEGAEDEIPNVPLDELIDSLQILRSANIIPKCLVEIWNTLKDKKGLENIDWFNITAFDGFFYLLPMNDIVYMINKAPHKAEYFGQSKFVDRQHTTIIMSALISNQAEGFYLKHENLNPLSGLICGWPDDIMDGIEDEEFSLLDAAVFKNMYTCSRRFLRMILEHSMKPTIFGPPQVWDAKLVKKMGALLLGLLPEELISIRPPAMAGITEEIMNQFEMNLIKSLTFQQIMNLRGPVFGSYKRRTFYVNKQAFHGYNFNLLVLLFIISLSLY